MSYDVSLDCPTCKQWHGDHNYTSNVAPMFYKAFPKGGGLKDLQGLTGKSAGLMISLALSAMEADPDTYKEMNPDNGWGNYEGAMKFLRDIRRTCKEYPDLTVDISA